MLAEERRLRIREQLTAHRAVLVADLMKEFSVTTATVRRDLAELEGQGVLIRSHGGAILREASTDLQLPYEALRKSNISEKEAIAAEAEPLIQEGDTVFLEGSTTVYELACRLSKRSHLTVVTNSPPILDKLQRSPGITVMSTGGELQKDTAYLSGVWAQRALSEIRVDKAVLGVSAIDLEYGISTTRLALSEVKKLLVTTAKIRIGLADHTKFGKQDFVFVGPVTDFQVIVTDSGTPQKSIAALREKGVDVLVAKSKPS
jgi:DeoR/GlpR family transcriptional regulator of sugar metabolism